MARVLVIGDTHCPGMRRGYIDFLKRVADQYSCNRVVHIGDLVDWHSISYHERHTSCPSPATELREARKQVEQIHRAFPNADLLLGNHDALTERQVQTAGLPREVLRDYGDLWQIGWTVHPRFSRLAIDGVLYAHGDAGRGGQNASLAQAKEQFRSCVIGHYHSQAGVTWLANQEFRIFGLSAGCGIDASRMQFEYGRKMHAKPILGCGVVIDGKRAYFEPWLLRSR